MLNQVPRPLLNIGIDLAVENKTNPNQHTHTGAGGSPRFDWDSLTPAAEGDHDTKTGEGVRQDRPMADGMVTPRARRANSGGVCGAAAEFLGAGEDNNNGGKAPPPLSATRGRGRTGARGHGGNGDGPPSTPFGGGRLRSTFTNESIADQALKDFGDGAVSTSTIEERRCGSRASRLLQCLLYKACDT